MDNRVALPKDYDLVIKDKESKIVVRELSVIGFGGSCIVYKGKKNLSYEDDTENCTVVVKEFFPTGIGVSRRDDMNLSIMDEIEEITEEQAKEIMEK